MPGRSLVAALVLACALAAVSFAAPRGSTSSALAATRADAETLFVAGEFARADSCYARVLAGDPRDTLALKRRAAIALLGNHTAEARRWANAALARVPGHRSLRNILAESYYREDDFAHAAPLFRATGREGMAKQCEFFAGRKPYRITGGASAEARFVQTDPLPVIEVAVNGRAPTFFIIDTGGAELVIDDVYADSVHAVRFGADSATFAGGRRGSFEHGAVDSVTIGGVTVHDLPVSILSTRRFAGAAGGRRVDGIVGTVFLYHFLATLDYRGGALRLAPRGSALATDSATVVPFWMAGNHYMVTRGSIGLSPPLLWFVDTGLAGGGFTCPASTLREAGIDLSNAPSFAGQGGGGTLSVKPFNIDRLTLGPLQRSGIVGMFGAFPESMEYAYVFRIGGLISHGFLRAYSMTMDFDRMCYVLR
jgi:hypothetical protein